MGTFINVPHCMYHAMGILAYLYRRGLLELLVP